MKQEISLPKLSPVTTRNASLSVLLFLAFTLLTAGQSSASAPNQSGLNVLASNSTENAFQAVPVANGNEARPAASSGFGPELPIAFQYDDGVYEWRYGFGNSYYNTSCAAIWLNRFSTSGVTFPLTLTVLSILWPPQSQGSLLGLQVRLLVYRDADSNNDPSNAQLIWQSTRTVDIVSTSQFENYPINVRITGPGDLYLGFESRFAESEPHPLLYPAAVDTTTTFRSSWLIANTSNCTPNYNNLGSNEFLNIIDYIPNLYPGNFLIRAYGDTAFHPTATPTQTNTPTRTNTPTDTPTPLPPRCPSERFTDVCPGDYFYTAVLSLNSAGVVSGYNSAPPCDGVEHIPCFKPFNNTTRGQLSKIVVLANAWSIYTPPTPTFVDVPVSNPFYPYIETAYYHSVISGYADGTFRPGNNITRGQLCKVIVLARGWTILNPPTPTFTDVPVSHTFYTYIETAYRHNIISGYSCGTGCLEFRPSGNATRGQICKIVYQAINEPTPTPTSSSTSTTAPTNTAIPTNTYTPIIEPTETETTTPTGTVAVVR